jgi:hypothetical protein
MAISADFASATQIASPRNPHPPNVSTAKYGSPGRFFPQFWPASRKFHQIGVAASRIAN